jgi:hypothetical protein
VTAAIRHIVFSDSGARVLEEALRESGREDQVISFPDDLGVGPINPPDSASRDEWVRREFAIAADEWHWPIEEADRFWEAALSTTSRHIVWVSRRVVREYAGFLEFIRRAGDEPYDVVDLTDIPTHPKACGDDWTLRPLALSDLYNRPEEVLGFLGNAMPLTAVQRDNYQLLWERLRLEDAPLRVITDDGLISAPLSYFDDLLVSCTIAEWRKVARVLAEALFKSWEGGFFNVNEVVLAARVRALAAAGRVEGRGDLFRIRHSEIRLPRKTPTAVDDPARLASSVSQ